MFQLFLEETVKKNLYKLSKKVVDSAIERNLTISTAESFTGGYIAKSLTDIPGCSNVLVAGLVTYMIKAKEKFLGVKDETINTYTVVSKEVVCEMALGALNTTGSDVTIATTGYAGPGDAPETGKFFIGIAFREGGVIRTIYKEFYIDNTREFIRETATKIALEKVYKIINGGLI